MKKQLKNVRIVSDNGQAVLISRKRFHCLLETLEVLSRNSHANGNRSTAKRSAMTGD